MKDEKEKKEIKADACNEETLVSFASTHKLSESKNRWTERKGRKGGNREKERRVAVKC